MKRFWNHPVTDAVLMVLCFLLVQALCGTLAGLIPLKVSQSMLIIIISSVASLLSIVLFVALKWASLSMDYLRRMPLMVLLLTVVAALGALFPSAWLQEQLPEQLLPNIAEEALGSLLTTPLGYVAVALLAPLAEEVVFRGAALRLMLRSDRVRPWAAIIISALLFGLAHANPAQLPHAILIGILLGWIYWRTGSIVPTVLYHWVNNSVAFLLAQIYPDPDLKISELVPNAALASCLSLLVLAVALYGLNKKTKVS